MLLLLLGFTLFPLTVFWLGETFAGAYSGGNARAYLSNLTRELAGGSPFAWLVVLAPLLFGQLLRLAWSVLRRFSAVNSVTVNEDTQ